MFQMHHILMTSGAESKLVLPMKMSCAVTVEKIVRWSCELTMWAVCMSVSSLELVTTVWYWYHTRTWQLAYTEKLFDSE